MTRGEHFYRTLGLPLALTIILFAISWLSIVLTRNWMSVATLWPVNAIILAVLLRSTVSAGRCVSVLLGGAVAIGLANVAVGNGAGLSTALALANILEVVIAWALLVKLQTDTADLARLRNLIVFIIVAAGFAPAVSATAGAAAVAAANAVPWIPIWANWYASDALGMIIVAPFLLGLRAMDWRALHVGERLGEAASVLAVLVLAAAIGAYYRPLIFLVVPATLFATMRFKLVGAAVGTLVTAVFATAVIVLDIGPIYLAPNLDVPGRILLLQVFLGAMALWSLPVAAILDERDRLTADLDVAKTRVEAENAKKAGMVVALNRRLSSVEEAERLRLSHELHDQTGQSLASVLMQLKGLESLVDGAARDRLAGVRKDVEETGKVLHRVAWELRPLSIDAFGLTAALESYVGEWGSLNGIAVDFCCVESRLDDLPDTVGTIIYRVIQEALVNVVKHAEGARNVSVVIERRERMLQIIVEDDGCGFDVGTPSADGARGPLGIKGMRERLAIIDGKLDIESSRGAGTTVYARIPLE